jgi:phosphate transport system substrate-binding protein
MKTAGTTTKPERSTLISNRITRRAVALAAVSAVALPAVAMPASAAAKPTITLSGSTTVAPLAALLIRKYLNICHHCAKFKLLQGGSNIGISDVAHGRVSIGDSSRDPAPSDPGGLVFTPIARDAICLITNARNTLGALTQTTTQQIFSGKVVDWSGVPGATVSGTIDLYTRNAASGTHDAFQKLVMNPLSVATTANTYSSNGLVEQHVSSDPNGIGYVSLHFGSGVHAVSYQGVACTLRDAKSGTYPAVRSLYMVTLGNPAGAVGKFIHWIRTSPKANTTIASDWVPLH